MDTFSKITTNIIHEQELVIGPLAWAEAKKVSGLSVDQKEVKVSLGSDPKQIIDRLVAQYDRLFGGASHEVSREAARPFLKELSLADMPLSLQ